MSKYRIVETSTNDDGYLHEQGRVINGKPNKHGCKPLFELKRQKLVPLEDVLALPQAPAWSQERPTVPGHYWYRQGQHVDICQVRQVDLDVWDQVPHTVEAWAGPIDLPKERT